MDAKPERELRRDLCSLPPSAWLTTVEAAVVLGLSPATLHTWRCKGDERLPYFKRGRLVRYRRSDLDRLLGADAIVAVPR